MPVKRHLNAKALNPIINDPDVFRWVKGNFTGDYLDMSPVIANTDNVLLMGEGGGVLFVKHQLGLYEAHVQMLPEKRGGHTFRMVQEALHWMFTRTDAFEITTRVPKGNLGARALVRAIHGRLEFRLTEGWVIEDKAVYADVYSLTIQEWMKTAPGLVEKGQWFHHRLEEEFQKHKLPPDIHPEDPVHDRYVGVAVEMFLNGQRNKGVILYGRIASMAGYHPVHLEGNLLDIGNALLMLRGNDFWMVRCQSAQQLARAL